MESSLPKLQPFIETLTFDADFAHSSSDVTGLEDFGSFSDAFFTDIQVPSA